MIFTETKLCGAYYVDLEKIKDERGFFGRFWDCEVFKEYQLDLKWFQGNISWSKTKGTIRGLHYQTSPFQEAKLIRCTRGSIFDVIVDLNPESDTFENWYGTNLSAENHRMLYVPEGFAHGFLTLVDDTEVNYLVSQYYTPKAEAGIRYNDPYFKIEWPSKCEFISDKDLNWLDYSRRIQHT